MKISARNVLTGKITNLETGMITAKVQLDVNGTTITSVISKDSVDDLGLKVGDQVNALIKSTSIMIGKE